MAFGPELGEREPPPRFKVHAVTDGGGPLELIYGDNLEERLAEALSRGWQVLGFCEDRHGVRSAYVAEPISEEAWQERHRLRRRDRRREARSWRRRATAGRRSELAALAKEIRAMSKDLTSDLWGIWHDQRQAIARMEAFAS